MTVPAVCSAVIIKRPTAPMTRPIPVSPPTSRNISSPDEGWAGIKGTTRGDSARVTKSAMLKR